MNGGFIFAMCSATDSFDIALATLNVDIASEVFDGTPVDNNYQNKIDAKCFINTCWWNWFKSRSNHKSNFKTINTNC